MKDKNENYNFEDEDIDIDDRELNEHGYEKTSTSKRTINWRGIELAKEKLALKRELDDLDSWID